MFEAGEGHEGIYFLKDLDPEWLRTRGLSEPAAGA
jgi:hypothetical protein